jgi:hypothetical protein
MKRRGRWGCRASGTVTGRTWRNRPHAGDFAAINQLLRGRCPQYLSCCICAGRISAPGSAPTAITPVCKTCGTILKRAGMQHPHWGEFLDRWQASTLGPAPFPYPKYSTSRDSKRRKSHIYAAKMCCLDIGVALDISSLLVRSRGFVAEELDGWLAMD